MNIGPQPGRRLAYAPLERYIALRWPDADDAGADRQEAGRPSGHRIARYCNVGSRETVCRWRREGLTVAAADHAANMLGVHPLLIWPDFHDDIDIEAVA